MRTEYPSKHDIKRAWHVIDANDAVLGRVASRAAMLLMGKHKTTFAPSIDTGDHVVIVNAAKIKLTGGKDLGNVDLAILVECYADARRLPVRIENILPVGR